MSLSYVKKMLSGALLAVAISCTSTVFAQDNQGTVDRIDAFYIHNSETTIMKPGYNYRIDLQYTLSEIRDIRVDLVTKDGEWIVGKQFTANDLGGRKAYDMIDGDCYLDIPNDIQRKKEYDLYVKILPVGANWDAYIAQRRLEVRVPQYNNDNFETSVLNATDGRAKNLDDVRIPHISVKAGVWESFYIPYNITTARDIRLSLIDDSNNFKSLSSCQVTKKPGDNTSCSVLIPSDIEIGKEYKIYVKMIPAGGQWYTFFDQIYFYVKAE
jgi:hypothetical protein